MKQFMDQDFLLSTDTARRLYHDYAVRQPLCDYHCHISPREVCEDRRFDNLAQVWLGGKDAGGSLAGDHYKWRLMRANGVPEEYITGGRPDYERFLKFVEALQPAIGNPMYHWCHMELRRFFGYDRPLTLENAKECWEHCGDRLRSDPALTVRGIIRTANVAFIGTTDDPTDSLEWHAKIAADQDISAKVCPSFRPDKALGIGSPGFAEYIGRLAESTGKDRLETVDDVCGALEERLEYFAESGCRASDHGLTYIPFRPASAEEVQAIYARAMEGEGGRISAEEAEKYQTMVLVRLGRAYHRLGIAIQLHYSCLRNANRRIYEALGPDAGADMITRTGCGGNIARLLSALDQSGELPKTILYSLDGTDNDMLMSLCGCFQSDEIPGKIQLGSAWWFMDTRGGMERQLRSFAEQGLLGNFIGMLTDSRSFLSYARHDYFRRILCNLVGSWVENGEYPASEENLRKIIEGICFKNAERYFGL